MPASLIERTPSAYDFPLTIGALLRSSLAQESEEPIVYRDLKRMSYAELGERVHRLAAALARLGVTPGDTVAVMDWDSHRYLEAFYAVPMMGAVLHTINPRLAPEQILYTIEHAEDRVILVHSDFVPILEALRDRLQGVKAIVLLSDGGEAPKTALKLAGEYEAMLQEAPTSYDFPELDERTRATTFYTTGTTGDPKGVSFSHRQIVLHTLSGLIALGSYETHGRLRSNDVYMPITPMFHVHAWGVPFMATLLGVKQVYPGRYDPPMLLKLLVGEKVTFSHCVPTILQMLLASEAVKSVDLRGWKVIIGGSALPQGLARAAMERGIDIYTGYGMSETAPILTLASLKPKMLDWSADKQVEVRCRTGRPIPLVDLRIVAPAPVGDLVDVPHDGKAAGEVVVRTPWLTQSYFKNPEASEALWRGGYLHTGDVGTIDAEGYLQLTDRIKDVIKSGGEWVSSLAIESAISQNPAVAEVAVIGVVDEKWGERPLALVVLRPDAKGKVSTDDIKATVQKLVDAGTLSRWSIPEVVEFVDALEKTSVGKLNKRALRERYGK